MQWSVLENLFQLLKVCNEPVEKEKKKGPGFISVEFILVEKYGSRVHMKGLNQSELVCVLHSLGKRVNIGNSTFFLNK